MPFKVVRNDITKMTVDAIVNPTNRYLKGNNSIDGIIHKAGGKQLDEECQLLNGCEVGDAKITKAYNLPCKYIIHTVGPIWRGGSNNEEKQLFSCYKRSIECAKEIGISSIAFPIISSGNFSFPKKLAIDIACKALTKLTPDNITVYLVIYDLESLYIGERTQNFNIEYMIKPKEDEIPIIDSSLPFNSQKQEDYYQAKIIEYKNSFFEILDSIKSETLRHIYIKSIYWDFNSPLELENIIAKLEDLEKKSIDTIHNMIEVSKEAVREIETINAIQGNKFSYNTENSFSKTLLEIIDKKGLKDSEIYRAANITKQTFSNIRCDSNYHPKKKVAISLALALKLDIKDTQNLLATAGYTLSNSIMEDVIIKDCILKEEFDIMRINLLLIKNLGHGL